MNGTIIFGVCMIIAGLFFSGLGLLPMLLGGVAVIAYGAFFTGTKPKTQDRANTYDDNFV
jgi:hypothetical protein